MKLVIATHNQGKVREINDILKNYNVEAISAGELNLPEPEETEDSFIGNALLKARAAAKLCDIPVLADDSGICIHGINNQPGIYSARWAGETKDFKHAMRRVEDELKANNSTDFGAHFVCALALVYPDGREEIFEGKVFGTVSFPPRGDKGFGYDPIFTADGETETFGEMDPDKKHAMSHRANAFKLLIAKIFND